MEIWTWTAIIWSWIPTSFWWWLAIAFFVILALPILLSFILWITMKKYKFHIWPVSFFCYSRLKMVLPINEFITIVLSLRHISVSWHSSQPFITFRARGLRIHVIQYNITKNPNIAQYVNDFKTKFLMGIRQNTKTAISSVNSIIHQNQNNHGLNAAPQTGFSQSLFERIDGILEEVSLQFVDVKSEAEKTATIAKYYYADMDSNVPGKVYGDFNVFIPMSNAAFTYSSTGALGIACEIPQADVNYRTSSKVSRICGISVLIDIKINVDINVDIKSANLQMCSNELHKLIYAIIDYVNGDAILYNCNKYTNLAKYKATRTKPTPFSGTSLGKLSVKSGHIIGTIYGTTKKIKEENISRKFPESDLKLSLPMFSLVYYCPNSLVCLLSTNNEGIKSLLQNRQQN